MKIVFGGKDITEKVKPILKEAEGLPVEQVAYILATAWHETGGLMEPIKETVMPHHKNKNPTDKQVIARLERAYKAGKLPSVKKPYWRSGFFGRGFAQLTHRANYRRFGIEKDPDKALDPDFAAYVLVKGMIDGVFTGKKLGDYINPDSVDYVDARRVVNGTNKASLIAGYAEQFEEILREQGWGAEVRTPESLDYRVDDEDGEYGEDDGEGETSGMKAGVGAVIVIIIMAALLAAFM